MNIKCSGIQVVRQKGEERRKERTPCKKGMQKPDIRNQMITLISNHQRRKE